MAALLQLSSVLEAQDITTIDVEMPEWPKDDGSPGIIRCRQMSAGENIEMHTISNQINGGKDWLYVMLTYCIIDESGERMLTLDHIPALKRKSRRAIDRLQMACLRLNDMLVSQEDDRKNA